MKVPKLIRYDLMRMGRSGDRLLSVVLRIYQIYYKLLTRTFMFSHSFLLSNQIVSYVFVMLIHLLEARFFLLLFSFSNLYV